MNILKIFAIFGLIGDWYKKAMDDGVVTMKEGAELLISLGSVIGLEIAPEVTALVTETASDALDAVEDAIETAQEAIDDVTDEGATDDLAVAPEVPDGAHQFSTHSR